MRPEVFDGEKYVLIVAVEADGTITKISALDDARCATVLECIAADLRRSDRETIERVSGYEGGAL